MGKIINAVDYVTESLKDASTIAVHLGNGTVDFLKGITDQIIGSGLAVTVVAPNYVESRLIEKESGNISKLNEEMNLMNYVATIADVLENTAQIKTLAQGTDILIFHKYHHADQAFIESIMVRFFEENKNIAVLCIAEQSVAFEDVGVGFGRVLYVEDKEFKTDIF